MRTGFMHGTVLYDSQQNAVLMRRTDGSLADKGFLLGAVYDWRIAADGGRQVLVAYRKP